MEFENSFKYPQVQRDRRLSFVSAALVICHSNFGERLMIIIRMTQSETIELHQIRWWGLNKSKVVDMVCSFQKLP